MIVAGRPVEFKHRARGPRVAHEFAVAPFGVVPDALRTIDLAAPALVAFRPLREFQLGIRQGGGLAGDRVNPVDDDVNVSLRLVRVAKDDGLMLLESLRREAGPRRLAHFGFGRPLARMPRDAVGEYGF
jgi:hypothetical protein